jgi:hypothetical protein
MSEPIQLPPEVRQWLEATMHAQALQSRDITRMADDIGRMAEAFWRMAEAFQRIAVALEREQGMGSGGPGGPGGEQRRQEWSGSP